MKKQAKVQADQDSIIAHAGVKSAPVKRFVRNKDVPMERETIRERLVMARVMNGMTAVQAAEKLGYKNSTQISQIEAGERKLPNDWQFLLKMSQVYAVSVDFLLGVSPYPERDAIASEHFAIMRGFEELQKIQSATMTTAFVRYAAMGRPSTPELDAMCTAAEEVEQAIAVLRSRNPEFDEEWRGSSKVLSSVERLSTAAAPIRSTIRRRKDNEEHFIALASGKKGPLAYLLDGQRSLELE